MVLLETTCPCFIAFLVVLEITFYLKCVASRHMRVFRRFVGKCNVGALALLSLVIRRELASPTVALRIFSSVDDHNHGSLFHLFSTLLSSP